MINNSQDTSYTNIDQTISKAQQSVNPSSDNNSLFGAGIEGNQPEKTQSSFASNDDFISFLQNERKQKVFTQDQDTQPATPHAAPIDVTLPTSGYDMSDDQKNILKSGTGAIDYASTIYQGKLNPADIMKQSGMFNVPVVFPSKEAFAKTNNLPIDSIDNMYEGLKKDYLSYKNNKFDPYDTKETYYPDTKEYRDMNLLVNKTLMAFDLPHDKTIINDQEVATVNTDELADSKRVFISNTYKVLPLSMAHTSGVNKLYKVQDADGLSWHWQEAQSDMQEINSDIIRSTFGAKKMYSDGFTNPFSHMFQGAVAAIDNTVGFVADVADVAWGGLRAATGNGYVRFSDYYKVSALNDFLAENPNANSQQIDNFMASMKQTSLGTGFYNDAKAIKHFNNDEIGYGTVSAATANFADFIGMFAPSVLLGWGLGAGVGVATELGADAITAANIANKVGTAINVIQGPAMFGGMTTSQLKDWGVDPDRANAIGGAIALADYLLQIPTNKILQQVQLAGLQRDLPKLFEEEGLKIASSAGKKTIAELGDKEKTQAIKNVWTRIAGLKEKMSGIAGAGEGFAGTLKETAVAGAEGYGHMAALFTVQNGLAGLYNSMMSTQANNTLNKYEGVQWTRDPERSDRGFRIDKDGKITSMLYDQWIAEQKDYNMAMDIKDDKNPLKTNAFSEAGSLALSIMAANFIKKLPTNLIRLGKEQAKQSYIDKVALSIAQNPNPDRMIASLKKNIGSTELDKDFISQDGNVVTTPRARQNQTEYDARYKQADAEYQQKVNSVLEDHAKNVITDEDKNAQLKQIEDEKDQAHTTIKADEDKDTPMLSKDEALKKALYDRILYRVEQIKRYGLDTPEKLKAINNSPSILSEILGFYDKLETVQKAKQEIANPDGNGKVVTPTENFFDIGEHLNADTSIDKLNAAEQEINRNIAHRGEAQEGKLYSERYNELYRSGLVDMFLGKEIAKKRLEQENITEDNTDKKKYEKLLNRKVKELKDKGITKEEQLAFIKDQAVITYANAVDYFDAITNQLFNRRNGLVSNVVVEHNQNIDTNAIKDPTQHIEDLRKGFKELHTHLDNILSSTVNDFDNNGKLSHVDKLGGKHTEIKESITNLLNTFKFNDNEVNNKLSSEIDSLNKDYQAKVEDSKKHLEELQTIQANSEPDSTTGEPEQSDRINDNAVTPLNNIGEDKIPSREDVTTKGPEGTKIDLQHLDKLSPEMQQYLRTKVLDSLLNGSKVDNNMNLEQLLKHINENINTIGGHDQYIKLLENIQWGIDSLKKYSLFNVDLFQKQMDNKEEKTISPLFSKSLESLSPQDKKQIYDFEEQFRDSLSDTIKLLTETNPSREYRQIKEKANALEIKHIVIKTAFDELIKLHPNDKVALENKAKIDEILNSITNIINEEVVEQGTGLQVSPLDLTSLLDKYEKESDPTEKAKLQEKLNNIELKFIEADSIVSSFSLDSINATMKSLKENNSVDLNKSQYLFSNVFNPDKRDKDNSKFSKDFITNGPTNDKNKFRAYLTIQYLNTYKDAGRDGRKTVKELYKFIENVQQNRQDKELDNKVFTYSQRQVLLQSLLNYDRGTVDTESNIFGEKGKRYGWSMTIDGYPGSGKTSVFASDYIDTLNELLKDRFNADDANAGKEYKPLEFAIISPNGSLLSDYKKDMKITDEIKSVNKSEDGKTFFLLKDVLDNKEQLSSLKENSVIIVDEHSLLNQDIYDDLKSQLEGYKGQVVFMGDGGQSHVEVARDVKDNDGNIIRKVYTPQEIRELGYTQMFLPAYKAGECSNMILTESFRSGDLQVGHMIDFLNNLRGVKGIGERNQLSTKCGMVDGKMQGIKFVEPKSFMSVIYTGDATDPGFIDMFSKLKKDNGDTSRENIMLVVFDQQMKDKIVSQYGADNPNIDKNIFLAYNDNINTEYLCSGLKSNNVFVALDFNYIDKLEDANKMEALDSGYFAFGDKRVFVSELLMTPFTRVASDEKQSGYLKACLPFESEYVTSKQLAKDEKISKYRTEDSEKLADARQRELDFLKKINEVPEVKKEESTEEKHDDEYGANYDLKLADESADKIMKKKSVKDKIINSSDSSHDENKETALPTIKKEGTKKVKEKPKDKEVGLRGQLDDRNIMNSLIKAKEDAITYDGKPVSKRLNTLKENNLAELKAKLDAYQQNEIAKGTDPDAVFRNEGTHVNYSATNVIAIAKSNTSILMAKGNAKGENGENYYYHIPMINVVGIDGENPICDFYFFNYRTGTKGVPEEIEQSMIQKAYLYAQEKGVHVNQIHNIEYGHANNKSSAIMLREDKPISNASLKAKVILENSGFKGEPNSITERQYWNADAKGKGVIAIHREIGLNDGEYMSIYTKEGDTSSKKYYLVGKTMYYDKDTNTTKERYAFVDSVNDKRNKNNLIYATSAEMGSVYKADAKRSDFFHDSAVEFSKPDQRRVSTSHNLFINKDNNAIVKLAERLKSSKSIHVEDEDGSRNPYHRLHEMLFKTLKEGDEIESKYVKRVDTYDGTTQDHVVMNTFTRKTFDNMMAGEESTKEMVDILTKLGAKPDDLKDNDTMFSFMKRNYLDFISNDFDVEIGPKVKGKPSKLNKQDITNIIEEKNANRKKELIDKAYQKIEDGFNKSNDPHKEDNIALNKGKLDKILSLANGEKGYDRAKVKKLRVGSLNKDWTKPTPIQDVIDSYHKNHNETELREFDDKGTKDEYERWGIDLVYQDKDNGINIPIRAESKKLTVEDIKKAKTELENYEKANKDVTKDNDATLALEKNMAFKILRFNYNVFENAPELMSILNLKRDSSGKLAMSRKDKWGYELKLNTVKSALDMMESIIEGKGDYGEYHDKLTFRNNPYNDDKKIDVDMLSTDAQKVNDYQVIYSHDDYKLNNKKDKSSAAEDHAQDLFKKGNKNEFDYSADRDALKQSLEDVLGSKTVNSTSDNRSPLRIDLDKPIIDSNDVDANILGNLHSAINKITGKDILMSLYKDENGNYSKEIGRHEAFHYITMFLLTAEQKKSLEKEVKAILDERGLPSTRDDIYEHMADEYMFKDKIPEQTWLGRTISKIKNFINRYVAIKLRLADIYYGADNGYFKDVNVRDFEGVDMNKAVAKEYDNEEVDKHIQQYLTPVDINKLTELYIPRMFRTFSFYSPEISEIYRDNSLFGTFRSIRDNINDTYKSKGDIKIKLITGEEKLISEMNIDDAKNLANSNDRASYNMYQLTKDDILKPIIQKAFYKADITKYLNYLGKESLDEKDKQVVQELEQKSYGEEKMNPDNLINGKFNLVLKTIPLFRYISNEKGYINKANTFVPRKRIMDVMHMVFYSLKSQGVDITHENWINRLSEMVRTQGDCEERNILYSLHKEFSEIYRSINQLKGVWKEENLDKYDKTSATYRVNKEFQESKLAALYSVLTKTHIIFESMTDANVGFWDKNRFKLFGGGKDGMAYKNVSNTIRYNMFSDDVHVSSNMKSMLMDPNGKTPMYSISNGKIYKGKQIMLDINDTSENLKTIKPEEKSALIELLHGMGINNITESFIDNLTHIKNEVSDTGDSKNSNLIRRMKEFMYRSYSAAYFRAKAEDLEESFRDSKTFVNNRYGNKPKTVADFYSEIYNLESSKKPNEDDAESFNFNRDIEHQIAKLHSDYDRTINKEFQNKFLINIAKDRSQYDDLISWSQKNKYMTNAKEQAFHNVELPNVLDFSKHIKEISKRLNTFDESTSSGIMKLPGDSWITDKLRTSWVQRMFPSGDEEQSTVILKKKLDKEWSVTSPKIEALRDNLLVKGLISFDTMISFKGAIEGDKESNFSNNTGTDLMSIIQKNFILEMNRNNPKILIPLFNFSDKSQSIWLNVFSGKDADSIFDFGTNEQGVSHIKVKDNVMYAHYKNCYDHYTQVRENSLKYINETLGETKITKDNIDEIFTKLNKDENFINKIQLSTLEENRDYKIKNGKVLPGDLIKLPSEKTIYDQEFLDKYDAIHSDTKLSDIEKQNALLDYMSTKRRSSLIDMCTDLIEGNYIMDEKLLPFYDKFNNEEYYKTTKKEWVDVLDEAGNPKKSKNGKIKRELKEVLDEEGNTIQVNKDKRTRLKELKKSDEARNSIMYEEDGQTHINSFLNAVHDLYHIVNKQFLHVSMRDEFDFKDTSDLIKRIAGMVSPTDSFNKEALYGVGDNIVIANLEDIGGTNPFLKEGNKELNTDGYNKILPWQTDRLFNSAGGELGNGSYNGAQKNQIFGHDRKQDKTTYIKSAMFPITEWEYKNSKYAQDLVEKSLRGLTDTNGVLLIDTYKSMLKKDKWIDANKKFNQYLHENNLQDEVIGLIVHPSSFKTGNRVVNKFTIVKDENGNVKPIDLYNMNLPEKLESFSVPSEFLGSQILKSNDSQSKPKFITQQNERLIGYLTHEPMMSYKIEEALKHIIDLKSAEIKAIFIDPTTGEHFDEKQKKTNLMLYLKKIAKADIDNKDNSVKLRSLLNNEKIDPELLKDNHIINFVNDIKSFLRAELSGNNFVQSPDFMKYIVRPDGMYEPSMEGTVFSKSSRPYLYTPGENGLQGTFEPIDIDQYKAWKKDKGNKIVVVKPADVVMEFHQKKDFGIRNQELHEVMNPDKVGINFYDEWHTQRTIAEFEKMLVDKNTEELEKNKSTFKFDKDTLLKGYGVFNLFPEFLKQEFVKRGFSNDKSHQENLYIIAKYYHDLNQALYLTTDRVPHSGFNSQQIGRYVAFSHDTGNVLFMSAEKNILDGSDYDIDELHTFSFYNRNDKYKTELKDDNDKTKTSNWDQKLINVQKKIYLGGDHGNDNIDHIFTTINISKLREYANKLDEKNNKVFRDSDLYTFITKHDQLQEGQNLVGHFINMANSVGTVLNILNTIKVITSKSEEGVLIPSELTNKITNKLLPNSIRLLLPENQKYLLQYMKLCEAYANAATDNSKENGLIGRLGINSGNTNLIHGLMLGMNIMDDPKIEASLKSTEEAGEYDMLTYVEDFINHDVIKKASQLFKSTNRVFSDRYRTNFSKCLVEAKNILIDNLGDVTPEEKIAKTREYDLYTEKALEALNNSSIIYRIYDFDLMRDIDPNEFKIDSIVNKMEFNLGTSLDDYSNNLDVNSKKAKLDTLRTNGIDSNKQIEFLENNFNSSYIQDKANEKIIRDSFDMNKFVSQSPLLLSYIDVIKTLKNTMDETFMSRKIDIFDDVLKRTLGSTRLTKEKDYKKVEEEKKILIANHFLDTLGKVSIDIKDKDGKVTSNKTWDMSKPFDRQDLCQNAPDIIKRLKIDNPNNDFVSKLQISNKDRTLPILESKNSRNNDPATTAYYSEEFNKLTEGEKNLLSAMNMVVYGFKTPNGSLSEMLGTKMEEQFSENKDDIQDRINNKNNRESLTDTFAINTDSVRKKIKEDDQPIEGEIINIGSEDYPNYFKVRKEIDKDGNEKLGLGFVNRITNVKVGSYGKNAKEVLEPIAALRELNFTVTNELKEKGTVTFSDSSYFKVFPAEQINPNKPNKIVNGSKAMTENGVLVRVRKNGNRITLTQIGNVESIGTSNLIAKNIPRELSIRVAGDSLETAVDKMKSMFPNVKMEFVNDDTAEDRQSASYIKNGIVYINSDRFTADTPIHELAHIVTEVLSLTDRETYNKLYSEAQSMIESNTYLKDYLTSRYNDLSGENVVKEAMSLILGWKSEEAVYDTLLHTGDLDAKKNSQSIWENIKDYVSDIYNKFINYVGRLFLGPDMKGITGSSDMTLTELGEKLYNAWESDSKLSNVSTKDLKKIIELSRGEKDSIIKNVIKDVKDMTEFFYGDYIKDSRFTKLNDEEKLAELFTDAMSDKAKKKGLLFVNGIVYDFSKKTEAETKDYINKKIIPNLNNEQETWVSNMLTWLNKGADIKKLEGVLGNTSDAAIAEYHKFLRAIDYNPNFKYVRYSDLKNVEGYKDLYNEALEGYNPIVAIEKDSNNYKQKVLSIYDITPEQIVGQGAYNTSTEHGNILRKILSDVKANSKGITLTNKISDVRALHLQLLMNHINSMDGNIVIRNIGLHSLTAYKHNVFDIDSARMNANIKALRNINVFYDSLSPELKKAYNNKYHERSVDMTEYLKHYYQNIVINEGEDALKQQSDTYLGLTNQLELRDSINFRINQLTKIKGMLSQKEMTELKLLEESYRYMYGLRSYTSQLNSREVINTMSLYITPTMNIGDEAFKAFRNAITQGSNEVVEKLNENFKARLYGTKDKPGLIRELQKLLPRHQMVGDQEFKSYKPLYGTIKDKNGKDIKTGVLLFSANVNDYIKEGYSQEIAEQFADQGRQLDSKVLDTVNKLTDYVKDLYLERIQHETYLHTGKRIPKYKDKNDTSEYDNSADAKLKSYSDYKKGFVPTMKSRGNEDFFKNGNMILSTKRSLEEMVQEFTTFDDRSERQKNQYGLVDKIGDSFMSQIGYKFTGNEKPDDIIVGSPDFGDSKNISNRLGLNTMLDAKTNKYIYEAVGDKNDDISTDLHSSLLYFSLATARKEIYEEKVIPHLNAMLAIMKELSYSHDVNEYKDTNTLYKMMLAYSDKSMHGIGTIRADAKIGALEKTYQIANRVLTPLVLFGNAAIPTVHLMYKTMQIGTMSLGNILYDTGIAKPQHFAEASAIFFGDMDRALSWAYRYQLIRSTEKEAITNRLQTIGKNNDPVNWYGNLGNEALEIYTRTVTMVAQMIHDGSWDAHQYDKVNAKEKYVEEKDKRWKGEEGKILKDYYLDQLSLEDGLHDNNSKLGMKRGYFWKAMKATEVINSRLLSAAYTGIESPMMESFFLGKVVGKFHRWMYSQLSNIIQKGQYVDEGGRVILTEKDGKKVAEWEQLYIEGWGRTTINLIRDLAVTRDPNTWNKLNKYQKANMCKAGSVVAANLALLIVYRYIMSDDEKKKMHKDKTMKTMFEKEAFKSVEGLLLWGDLNKLIASPFSIPNIINRMLQSWTQNKDITMSTLGRNVAVVNDWNMATSTPEETKKQVLIHKSK